MTERVFITGLAAVSCLGNTLAEIEASLRTGRNGVVLDPRRRELGFRRGLYVSGAGTGTPGILGACATGFGVAGAMLGTGDLIREVAQCTHVA